MNKNNKKRLLTPYEKNQLLKYKIGCEELICTDAPVEYLTKHVDFCGSIFYVDENVLIPRVETEELVEMAVKKVKEIWELNLSEPGPNKNKTVQIVDVGTGSGAIAISVGKKLKNLGISYKIVGVDISESALAVAKKNLVKIDSSLPVKFVKSDLLLELNSESDNKIDLIIANLPYIPSSRIEILDNSVKDFEPHLALDGGKDGLDLVRKLLEQAKLMLSKNGAVLLELDITHTKEKMKEFKDNWKVKIIESEFGGVMFGVLLLK